jgi:dTDP-4-amino-4,6-dideoxygalactose transaminase
LIEEAEIAEVVDSLRKGWPGPGPKVAQFERDFAAYKGMPYAAALNSCTAGLHLACLSLDLKPGDEVITTALTFCATVNAIIHAGATPRAGREPGSGNIDPPTSPAGSRPAGRFCSARQGAPWHAGLLDRPPRIG